MTQVALKRPTYFLFRSQNKLVNEEIPEIYTEIPCIGKVYAGPITVKTRTRNPFYTSNDYSVWIRHFDLDCLIKDNLKY